MKFLDQAKVYVKSGDGGDGCVAFRREKYVEFGGPDGGDGGRGGDVIVSCLPDLNTLIDFRYQQHFKGRRGQHGMGKNRSGRKGEPVRLQVPLGTQILAEDGEMILADMTEADREIILAKGGDGGRGNSHFKSSTNQAPHHAEPGYPGAEMWIWLRLKLIADAGLIGLPNAGKSTFLSVVTRARPKIANYPFTTLHPNLGVAYRDGQEIVIADIPGLIKGAHEGAGLGDRFLGHIERCGVLLHVIDGTDADMVANYRTVHDELAAYGGGLASKTKVIALNKCDALTPDDIAAKCAALAEAASAEVMTMSGISGDGVSAVLGRVMSVAREAREAADVNTAFAP